MSGWINYLLLFWINTVHIYNFGYININCENQNILNATFLNLKNIYDIAPD